MARLELEGFAELDSAFAHIANIPKPVKEKALQAMANVAAPQIKRSGESMGVRDRESSEHILDSIKLNKPTTNDDGGHLDITFTGRRTRGNTTTRNAEIAFVNEYGKRNQQARPFIGTAMNQYAAKIAEAGADILWDYIEREFEK